MVAYYNEWDPYAAQWLRNLIAAGHIADGDVDERSICEVDSKDLVGYDQCHFFAGIGGWGLALRLAGWPDDRAVWTGSCPCQPFSAAGQGKGVEDERHLWPDFHRLIAECRPSIVFGEQVASKDGLGWLDAVCADMEASGYAVGAADMCAAGIGAPHIRQRLWWVAHADNSRLERRWQPERERAGECVAGARGVASGLADAASVGRIGRGPSEARVEPGAQQRSDGLRDAGGLADAAGAGSLSSTHAGIHRREESAGPWDAEPERLRGNDRPSPIDGFWRDADWLFCRDGKWRPVEPGTFPLAHGISNRVGRLRAYGNAIVPQVAAQFIGAYLET